MGLLYPQWPPLLPGKAALWPQLQGSFVLSPNLTYQIYLLCSKPVTTPSLDHLPDHVLA